MKKVKGWHFPDADELMCAEMNEKGEYQADHLAAAMEFVTGSRLAIDGGAHVGTWSRIMATKFARVLAFEPAMDTHEALAANMAQFGCSNVTILRKALSDQAGQVHITLEDDEDAMRKGNTGARYMRDGGPTEAVTIDSLQLDALDFIKLDIEGAEYKAIKGAEKTLKRCRPVLLFEDKAKCQRRFGITGNDIYRLLHTYGYRHMHRAGQDEIWLPAW